MRNLYIDCDGVIFDTIKVAFREMKELNVNLADEFEITNYFKNVDWNYLIDKGGILNDSIEKIKLLDESNEFDSVKIATHRCSYDEGIVKTKRFSELIPNIKIITIPRKINKHHALPAYNHILIDDSKTKVREWIENGGIGIVFNPNVDHLIYPYELNDNPYFITNDILDALVVNNLYKNKTYSK